MEMASSASSRAASGSPAYIAHEKIVHCYNYLSSTAENPQTFSSPYGRSQRTLISTWLNCTCASMDLSKLFSLWRHSCLAWEQEATTKSHRKHGHHANPKP